MNLNIFQDKLLDFLADNPNFCVYQGLNKNLGDLPDPGKNKRVTTQGKLKMLKRSLEEISFNELTLDEQIDHKLCEYQLEQERLGLELEIDNVPQNMRMPKGMSMIIDPIFMLFINDPRSEKLRLVNIISRLEKVPMFLISYQRNLREPVKRWLDMELESLAGVESFLETISNWAESINFKNMALLKKVTINAKSAFLNYKTFLKNMPTSKNIFLGNEQMQMILDSRGIKESADELHAIATNFLAKNLKQREAIRSELCTKYDLDISSNEEELSDFLIKKFSVKNEHKDRANPYAYILSRYEQEREEVLSFIKDEKLFNVMDDQDMKIIQTPDFMMPTIPAGAMMPPSPFREGVKRSMVYLTLSEELLAEHTELNIPMMMIHEGIPGHHLQFSWACSNKSVVRKYFSANDYSEGWTTMLEDYMLDAGYKSDLKSEIRFFGKKDIARVAARVAIDLYFMSGDKKYLDLGIDCDFTSDDPFVCAGNLLKVVTGFVDGRVQGEINWYSQERGYPLTYLTGNHLVWDLKKKFQEMNSNLDKKEQDRQFHKKYLEAGNMPVSLLSNVFFKK